MANFTPLQFNFLGLTPELEENIESSNPNVSYVNGLEINEKGYGSSRLEKPK